MTLKDSSDGLFFIVLTPFVMIFVFFCGFMTGRNYERVHPSSVIVAVPSASAQLAQLDLLGERLLVEQRRVEKWQAVKAIHVARAKRKAAWTNAVARR